MSGVGIVAANDDVAVQRSIGTEQLRGHIVKSSDHAHSIRHEFGRLLCGTALPHAQGARSASANTGCEGHSRINKNAAFGDGRLQFL